MFDLCILYLCICIFVYLVFVLFCICTFVYLPPAPVPRMVHMLATRCLITKIRFNDLLSPTNDRDSSISLRDHVKPSLVIFKMAKFGVILYKVLVPTIPIMIQNVLN